MISCMRDPSILKEEESSSSMKSIVSPSVIFAYDEKYATIVVVSVKGSMMHHSSERQVAADGTGITCLSNRLNARNVG